jgi:phosphatidylserine decarboxylase
MSDKKMTIYFFKILPKSLFSRLFGYIARIPLPQFLLKKIMKWYIASFGVLEDEMVVPEKGFKNLDKFFTRQIKPESHPVDKLKKSIVSPVDGRVDQYGEINNETLIQAKGISFSLKDLIPSDTAASFKNGSFMTLYLSPGDYHRIHSPISGKISGYYNLPGKLYTVQEFMVKGLPGLFCINERLVSYVENNSKLCAVIKVGAMNVGRMSLSYDTPVTNKAFRKEKEFFYEKGQEPVVEKGGELGIFHLGSTIVLLFEKDAAAFDKIEIGTAIRMGQKIGSLK